MVLPKSFTTVTPLSKAIAMILFVLLPFAGFYVGYKYHELTSSNTPVTQNNPISTPAITSASNSTADFTTNWKTYANSDYTIKYPPSLTIVQVETYIAGNSKITLKNDAVLQKAFITIDTWKNSQNKYLQQFIFDYSNGSVSNEELYVDDVHSMEPLLGYINAGNRVLFIENKRKVYIFSLNNAYDIKTKLVTNKNAEALFNQILSTFKFTQ